MANRGIGLFELRREAVAISLFTVRDIKLDAAARLAAALTNEDLKFKADGSIISLYSGAGPADPVLEAARYKTRMRLSCKGPYAKHRYTETELEFLIRWADKLNIIFGDSSEPEAVKASRALGLQKPFDGRECWPEWLVGNLWIAWLWLNCPERLSQNYHS